jgi:alanyl-tRNA synthetase
MNRKELIKKYIDFFKSKDHAQIKNSSLVPENDPTVLFTTAGMHPLVPFLLGETHPQGKRVVNVQRCIRTGDIEEVGDTSHHTFFEMLGNWSLGDYFKKGGIEMSYEFLIKVLGLQKERLAVSVFKGNENGPCDEESAQIWKDQGIPEERIAYLPAEDNWWGPAGQTGPCGPCTEMFYWKLNNKPAPKKFDPEDDNWVEIWNDVLMEYNKDSEGNYNKASQQNVDTGMGTERTVAVLDSLEDNYLADMWKPIIEKIETISKHTYSEGETIKRAMRIIADHIKAAAFIINDGIAPSNSDQGYVLRRLIRRAIRYGKTLGIESFTSQVASAIYPIYDDYKLDKEKINSELEKEEEGFNLTLEKGLRIFEKRIKNSIHIIKGKKYLIGADAFLLFQSYGFPIEMTIELAKEKGIKVDKEGFEKELKKHQKLSRTASAGKFKSGLADNSEQTTKLHTASHLLNEALREVLKDKNISQRGSNITPERLRFDFNFNRKLTDEEKEEIENLINEKIKESIPVKLQEMSIQEAKELGAHGMFDDKYGDKVKVYKIGNFSKEICAGPHVQNTSELGTFKIKKEGSSSSGVRRIKAILE